MVTYGYGALITTAGPPEAEAEIVSVVLVRAVGPPSNLRNLVAYLTGIETMTVALPPLPLDGKMVVVIFAVALGPPSNGVVMVARLVGVSMRIVPMKAVGEGVSVRVVTEGPSNPVVTVTYGYAVDTMMVTVRLTV
jgi:hypothetical protein